MKHSRKKFLRGFIPSKEILVVCSLFYILGIVFAFMNPGEAMATFPGGLFLGNIEVKIQPSGPITLDYILNQFIFYLGHVSLNIFLNNLFLIFLCVISGIAIFPLILVGLFMKIGVITFFIIEKLGFNGILVLLGSFHIYFEFLAAMLAIDGFFKLYIPLLKTIKDKDFNIFKNSFIKEFLPQLIRIVLLLAFASILEVFWSTWWVYILTDHYISWYDFYFGAYSILLK